MSGGKFDFKEVKQLQKQIAQLDRDRDKFCEDCARYLAARLLAKVIKRTPSDSGNLRRGWTTQGSGSGSEGLKTRGASQYADTLKVNHFGDTYVVEIINPVEYASYVEFGHRTANHKGWVPGKFMLTNSERELEAQAPKMIEKRISDYLKGAFHV
ncbi:MAG: HK97 gp10 family phage protein [Hungatella sp.]|nr:HK97 gp10 family phage protein [Hungatella sp.]